MIGERFRWPTIIVLALCLLGGFVRQARSENLAPLIHANSLSGSFEQRILDSTGEQLSNSSGSFAVLRPHFFRWTVMAPGRLNLVYDGIYLWQHDIDLETVSRSTLDPGADLPLQVLLSDEIALAERFDITRTHSSVTLIPKTEKGLFEAIELVFASNQLARIHINDSAGQRIEIALELYDGVDLLADDFRFDVPDGIDIAIQD